MVKFLATVHRCADGTLRLTHVFISPHFLTLSLKSTLHANARPRLCSKVDPCDIFMAAPCPRF